MSSVCLYIHTLFLYLFNSIRVICVQFLYLATKVVLYVHEVLMRSPPVNEVDGNPSLPKPSRAAYSVEVGLTVRLTISCNRYIIVDH